MKRLKDAELSDGWKAYGISCLMSEELNVTDGIIINENDIKKIIAGNTEELEKYLSDIRLYDDLAVRVSIGNPTDSDISYKGIFKSKFDIPFDMEKLKDAVKSVSESAKEKIGDFNVNKPFNIIIQKMLYNTVLSGFAFSNAIEKNGEKIIRIEINEELTKKAVPGRKTSSVVTIKRSELFTEDPKINIHGKPHNYDKMIKLARTVYRLEKYFNKPVFVEWCTTNNNYIYFYYAEPMADAAKIMNIFCRQTYVSIPYAVKPYLQLTVEIEEYEKEIKRSKDEELEFQNRISNIRNKYKSLKIGDIFEFGNYNGRKLKWKVLDIKNDKIYIFCQSFICKKQFDESETPTNLWKQCTLRKWLNEYFYKLTFDNAEKDCIIEVNSDKITVLTKEEVKSLLKTIDFWDCWLRTAYPSDDKDDIVYYASELYTCSITSVRNNEIAVRPALYLKL